MKVTISKTTEQGTDASKVTTFYSVEIDLTKWLLVSAVFTCAILGALELYG